MKCAACKMALTDETALRVDGLEDGKPITFFVHRPSEDGRCFSRAVLGLTDRISLVSAEDVVRRSTTVPMHCPVCVDGEFYGKLVFEGEEIPVCPNAHYIEDGSVYAGTKPDAERIEVQLVPAR